MLNVKLIGMVAILGFTACAQEPVSKNVRTVNSTSAGGESSTADATGDPISSSDTEVKVIATEGDDDNGLPKDFSTELPKPSVLKLTNPPKPVLASNGVKFDVVQASGKPVDGQLEAQLDGKGFNPTSVETTLSNLTEGRHSWEVRIKGTEGPTLKVSWVVDLTKPVISIDLAPPAVTNTSSSRIMFSVSDLTRLSYSSSVDGGTAVPTSGEILVENLAPGKHTVMIYAEDAAGNKSGLPVAWTVDTGAPSVALESPVFSTTEAGLTVVKVGFSGTDGAAQPIQDFECSLDGLPAESCLSPFTSQGTLQPGVHVLSVTGTSAIGVVTTPAKARFIIADPPTMLVAPPTQKFIYRPGSGAFSAKVRGANLTAEWTRDTTVVAKISDPDPAATAVKDVLVSLEFAKGSDIKAGTYVLTVRNSGGTATASTALTVLDAAGTWASRTFPCDSSTVVARTDVLTANGNLTMTETIFRPSDCYKMASAVTTASVVLGKTVALPMGGDVQEYDLKPLAVEITPKGTTGAAFLNRRSFCGFTNWSANTKKTIAARAGCMYGVGTSYGIIKINPAVLPTVAPDELILSESPSATPETRDMVVGTRKMRRVN
jgi:hypothetical protein